MGLQEQNKQLLALRSQMDGEIENLTSSLFEVCLHFAYSKCVQLFTLYFTMIVCNSTHTPIKVIKHNYMKSYVCICKNRFLELVFHEFTAKNLHERMMQKEKF